jgi:hypothetical protein
MCEILAAIDTLQIALVLVAVAVLHTKASWVMEDC